MSVAQPPSENLPEFNNAVFKEANSTELSLAKANTLYLARTGNASSSASSTTFSGSVSASTLTSTDDIFIKGAIRAGMGVNTGSGLSTPATSQQTAFGLGALVANNTLQGSTAFGYNALNVYRGTSPYIGCTAVGSNALLSLQIGGYSTAVGINALKDATGTSNNAFGANAGTALTLGTENTFIGADTISPGNTNKITTGSKNTFVSQNPTCPATASATSFSTMLGYTCTVTGDRATAIGANSSAVANQISLGTATEYVTCKGTNTTNGALQLAGGLVLQTTYGTIASNMLGYSFSGSTPNTTFVTGIATGTANITTIALPSAGVWAIDYSVELTVNTSAMTVSIQSLYCSLTSNGTFAQRISNSGITRIHSSNTYAINDNPVFSSSFVYYVSTATTVYPVFSITTTAGTGTVTGTGYYNATRVG